MNIENPELIHPARRTSLVQEYYFSRKLKQMEEMRRNGFPVINLGIGSPDLPPHPDVSEELSKVSANPGAHGYQSYNGILPLREAFSSWYSSFFNVELDPSGEILPLLGSKEGIMHVSMAFVNPGDEVLIPDPGYPAYESVTRMVGGSVRYYDLLEKNGWYPDLNLLEKQGLKKVKLMWVNYPHMPTGTKATRELFENLVAFARKHHILICNDNPYSFILNEEYLSILEVEGAREVALELNSLSKSHNMAGWRVGMIGGHREYIKSILQVKSNMDSGMFLGIQKAAVKALNADASWYKSLNSAYHDRRKIAFEILKELGCELDPRQAGLFLWARIPGTWSSSEDFADYLLRELNLFLTPGFIFGKNGNPYIRISLCSNKALLSTALERIMEANTNSMIGKTA